MKAILIISVFVLNLFANNMTALEELYEGKYKDYRKHKSIAAAYNVKNQTWIVGLVYKAPNKAVAKRVAIKKCKQVAKEHKLEKQCKTYSLNQRRYF